MSYTTEDNARRVELVEESLVRQLSPTERAELEELTARLRAAVARLSGLQEGE